MSLHVHAAEDVVGVLVLETAERHLLHLALGGLGGALLQSHHGAKALVECSTWREDHHILGGSLLGLGSSHAAEHCALTGTAGDTFVGAHLAADGGGNGSHVANLGGVTVSNLAEGSLDSVHPLTALTQGVETAAGSVEDATLAGIQVVGCAHFTMS